MSTRIIDRGRRSLLEYARRIGDTRDLAVGIPEDKGTKPHGDGELTIAKIAAFHEFGMGVPERSFLRRWFDENAEMIKDDLRKASGAVLMGRVTHEQAGRALGVKYVGMIQRRISQGIPPALAASTIAAKGSSVPLIDTGVLRASISYVLDKVSR